MSIVCGTDFSEPGAQAVAVAAALAPRLKEPLSLVHVGSLAEPVRDRLREEADRLRHVGVAVEETLLSGEPDEAIVEHAEKTGTHLVVLSALGHRSAARWLLGSVAERIARTCPIPVLVVRGADPFEAWSRGERPLRVLLGVDFSATSDAAVRWVRELRQLGPCDVIAAHIYWPPEERRRLGIHGPPRLAQMHPEVERVLARDLAVRVGELPGQGTVDIQIHIGFGRTADHLVQLAAQANVDLVVVGTHQRTGASLLWHGSVALAILHSARMAVACVPAPAGAERELAALPQIQRVLVPTDLSELGDHAVPYAYSVLHAGGVVHLLHVIEPHTLPNPLYAHYVAGRMPTAEERNRQRDEIAARLRALIPNDAAAGGIETQVEIAESLEVGETIRATAERLSADLICMSSHGRSGISRAIAGSVAQAVMTESRRPLLVVRPPRDSG